MDGRVENESDGDIEEDEKETSFSVVNGDMESDEVEVDHLRRALGQVVRWAGVTRIQYTPFRSRHTLATTFLTTDSCRCVLINIGGREFRTKMASLARFPRWQHTHLPGYCEGLAWVRLCTVLAGPRREGSVTAWSPAILPSSTSTGTPSPSTWCSTCTGGFSTPLHRQRELHICQHNCALTVQMDLDFWGLDDIHLQPCCLMKYYPQTTSARAEIHEEIKEEEKAKLKVSLLF